MFCFFVTFEKYLNLYLIHCVVYSVFILLVLGLCLVALPTTHNFVHIVGDIFLARQLLCL